MHAFAEKCCSLNANVHATSQDFAVDALEALEAAVTFAPSPLAAVKEARAWREVIAPTQQQVCGRSGGDIGREGDGGLTVAARHLFLIATARVFMFTAVHSLLFSAWHIPPCSYEP